MAAKKKFTGRKSKIDPYAHLVGTVSDKEIAEMSGTSTENVRTWRKRRGIGAPPEEAAAKAEAPKAAAKPAKKAKRKSSKKTRRRKSKLDPFRKELGVLPDKEIAEKAGTSAENVRAYRKRHGIPAGWRAEGDTAEAAAPAPAPKAKAAAKPAPAPKAKAPKTPKKGAPRAWAFRVTAAVGGAQKEYVTFGADVVEAAQLARTRLGERHADAFVEKIEVLGVAL